MPQIGVFANIASILVILLIWYTNRIAFKQKENDSPYILMLFIGCLIAATANVLSLSAQGIADPAHRWVAWIGTEIVYASYAADCYIWFSFFGSHFGIYRKSWDILAKGIVGALLVLLITNSWTGSVFTIDEASTYHRGALTALYFGMMIITAVATTAMYLYAKSQRALRLFPAIYVTAPVVATEVLALFVTNCRLVIPGLTLSLIGITSSLKTEDVYRDQLTGLFGRSYLSYLGNDAKIRAGKRLVGVMIDLNDFKSINDNFGHEVGDQALADMGAILTRVAGADGSAIRYSGDEFIVLIENRDDVSAIDVENAIQSELNEFNARGERPYQLVAAMGGDVFSSSEMDTSAFLRSLDQKMYAAKTLFYENANVNRRRGAVKIERERYADIVALMEYGFEKALEEGQFEVHFQPQYNQRDMSLFGAEALVRWRHPAKGMIPPNNFIPFLEQNGSITQLDEWVLRRTCAYQRSWIDAGIRTVPIAVNLSRRDLLRDKHCERLLDILADYDLDPSNINLEVTETAYSENPQAVVDAVKQFQGAGFKVDMDDFGSGYSSLNTLKDIPVDLLKLDMKFIDGKAIGSRTGKILSAITRMAHWLGIPVMAEGVETQEQAEYLLGIGCIYAQGYYFDRPMTADDFAKRLTLSRRDIERDSRITNRSRAGIDYFSAESILSLEDFLDPAGIIEFDGSSYELVRANKALLDFFKVLDESPTPRRMRNVPATEADAVKWRQAVQDAVRTMDTAQCDILCARPNASDERFWARFKFRFLRGYDGIYAVLFTAEDIDRYKKALYSNNELFGAIDLLEGHNAFGSVLVGGTEAAPRLTHVNGAAAEILGMPAHEVETRFAKDPLGLVAPDDREHVHQAYVNAREERRGVFATTARVVTAKGELVPVRAFGSADNVPGQPLSIPVMFITEQDDDASRSRARLLSSEEFSRGFDDTMKLFDTVGGAVIRISGDGRRILFASRDFCKMTGFTQDEPCSGRSDLLDSLVAGGSLVRLPLEDASGSNGPACELRIVTKSGEQKWVRTQEHRINLSGGISIDYVTFEDLSHEKSLEAEVTKYSHLVRATEEDTCGGGVFYEITGKRWTFEHATKGYLASLGYGEERLRVLTENDILALVHPDDRERVRDLALSCERTSKPYEVSYRVLNGAGTYDWFWSSCTFSDEGGRRFLFQSCTNLTRAASLMASLQEREREREETNPIGPSEP